jgi:hypothetical protein
MLASVPAIALTAGADGMGVLGKWTAGGLPTTARTRN